MGEKASLPYLAGGGLRYYFIFPYLFFLILHLCPHRFFRFAGEQRDDVVVGITGVKYRIFWRLLLFLVGEEILLAIVGGGGSHHLTEGTGKVLAIAKVEFLRNLDDGHPCVG